MTTDKLTFGEWLKKWLKVYKAPKIKASSLETLEICIRCHISNQIKDTLLRELDPLDIEEALADVKSSRMREYTYQVFCDSLRHAYRLGYIERDLVQMVEPVKHIRKQGKALTLKEQEQFLRALESNRPLLRFYTFILLTGCRRSEALSVRWSDIDLDTQTLTIPGTKTALSYRTIPLFPAVVDLLRTVPRDDENPNIIFAYTPRYVTRAFHSYIRGHTLHDLRHTFATRALESGVSIRVVQRWLGHSKLETTAGIYMHVLDEFQRTEALKFSQYQTIRIGEAYAPKGTCGQSTSTIFYPGQAPQSAHTGAQLSFYSER